MAKKEADLRYRLNVPPQDTSVLEWLKAQAHLSISLRLLIKEDIVRNGYTDVTCRSVEQQPKRGRPSAVDTDRRQSEMQEPPARRGHPTRGKAAKSAPVSQSPSVAEEPEVVQTTVAPSPVQSAVVVKQPEPVKESPITSLFAGGSQSTRPKPSAAAMGILDE